MQSIRYRSGPDAGVARFRYVFDVANPSTDPTSFQDALSVDSTLPGVVRNDDRLVVFVDNPDGTSTPLFDGFAQVPELSLSPSRELVTFLAYGVAIREWDTPIGGALMRNADSPATVSDVETDLPTQFNPDGQPNATPEGADAQDGFGNTYPTFLDALVVRSPDVRRPWTLPMAIRYLCFRHNASQDYVQNPPGSLIDSLLDSRSPIAGVTFQPDDPSTYTSQPILVADYPASGKSWPLVLDELLEPHGFGMAFRLASDESGDPFTYLDIFRREDASSSVYKDLYLQRTGAASTPRRATWPRPACRATPRRWPTPSSSSRRLDRYEASFVLAPGFPISSGDAADAIALSAFDRNSPYFSGANLDKYRLYVFDETGEGHWDFASSAMATAAPSLAPLLGGGTSDPTPYVKRRRAPFAELFSTDANRKPPQDPPRDLDRLPGPPARPLGRDRDLAERDRRLRPAQGSARDLDQRAQPQRLGHRRLERRRDAVSLRGRQGGRGPGTDRRPNFTLRLTCVIEGDRTLAATADQRPSSSTSYAITRRVDARDRYFNHVVAANSEFNTTGTPVSVRDDTDDALAEASAFRLKGETGEVAGSVTIPRFSVAYGIGDKIASIQGATSRSGPTPGRRRKKARSSPRWWA